jgi:hypothetical protein
VEESGEPVPNQTLKVQLPDGSERIFKLDSEGKARIPIGKYEDCKICFSELDQSAWFSEHD